jgi:hypothetical protein
VGSAVGGREEARVTAPAPHGILIYQDGWWVVACKLCKWAGQPSYTDKRKALQSLNLHLSKKHGVGYNDRRIEEKT